MELFKQLRLETWGWVFSVQDVFNRPMNSTLERDLGTPLVEELRVRLQR